MPNIKVDCVKDVNKVDLVIKFINILDLSGTEFSDLLTKLVEAE